MSEESNGSPLLSPLPAEHTYARVTGWIYLLLAAAGAFTDHLWHMITLSSPMTLMHLAIGVAGLSVARQGKHRAHRTYSLTVGFVFMLWGIAGTFYPQYINPRPLPLENALHLITGMWGFYGVGSILFSKRA